MSMPTNSSRILERTITPRRRKIPKACDFCRAHSVRCEADTPCPQCRANNVICNRSTLLRSQSKKSRTQNDDTAPRPLMGRSSIDTTPVNDAQSSESPIPTPSRPATLEWTSLKTDSSWGFIARINSFCSKVSQLFPDDTASSDPELNQVSHLPPTSLQETHVGDCDLSPSQRSLLMQTFRSHIGPQMSIVQLEDINLNRELDAASVCLHDAITAYSLHYIYHTGLNRRLVGLNWPQLQHQHGSKIGMPYFQRCLSAVTQIANFASPSISILKSYCYLVLYLLDSGHYQAAYNMVGLALRVTLSLNYMDARHGEYQGCKLFRRIWWTLIHLDYRCSSHVGKPVSIHVHDLMRLRPTTEPGYLSNPNDGLIFHTISINLTSATLVVTEIMNRESLLEGTDGLKPIEARAKILTNHLHHLQDWRHRLPREQFLIDLQSDVPDELPGVEEGPEILQNPHMKQSPMVFLLSSMLSLQYHNAIMCLHRVFIQFPSYPLVPRSNTRADAHAATALNHSLTMIKLAHDRMKIHDYFHGLSEMYQYLWNAVISVVGFRLAYPWCHRCPKAGEYLRLALEIFDSAGSRNTAATKFARLTRHLCDRFDQLIRGLKTSTQPPSPVLSCSIPIAAGQIPQYFCPNPTWTGVQDQIEGTSLPDLDVDSLLSWADLVNMDSWPTYCNGVNEVLMDPVDFFQSYQK